MDSRSVYYGLSRRLPLECLSCVIFLFERQILLKDLICVDVIKKYKRQNMLYKNTKVLFPILINFELFLANLYNYNNNLIYVSYMFRFQNGK